MSNYRKFVKLHDELETWRNLATAQSISIAKLMGAVYQSPATVLIPEVAKILDDADDILTTYLQTSVKYPMEQVFKTND